MIEKELSERINNEVDKLFDDQIRFTQKLTRFPSLRGHWPRKEGNLVNF